ncbi:methanogenic corrinoid protein MtbC1 [Methylobacterium brachythecii]|uniref:Methanogenic corrinoid protein MtbC1 n=1 Tax=Methylobacterium brachythecii TaxID=1176177 RepID=A0A7W6AQW4_9HYPH|nr:cobalamin B12-binding domain-containing protein [Methylobacterium brachythecii]MBB3905056.1 methanogenic corrinoid protein MtbC1 [Methylobacterium brachythecii]
MGAWRHFSQGFELDAASLECGPSPATALNPDLVVDDVSFVRGDLSRLIEGEILPRLMLVHQEAVRPSRLLVERRPTPEQIATFSALLLDPAAEDVTGHVLGLLDGGLSLDGLLLELLTPAARELGRLWEEDECDFVDVTVALGRLHAVARTLCGRLESEAWGPHGRSILLVPCPGETHIFCLSIVASFFREAGWDVTTGDADSGFDLLRAEWFDVVGLTLSCDVLLPGLADTVRAMRKVSCNRGVRVMVGGPLFVRHPEQLHASGADAMAEDARIAPRIAESLLEKQAQAC